MSEKLKKNENLINSVKRVAFKSSLLTALAVSFYACSGISALPVLCALFIAALFLKIESQTKLFPTLTGFILSIYILAEAGFTGAFLALLIGGFLTFITGRVKTLRAAAGSDLFKGALTISAALIVTVLITNLYFGIGASGNSAVQMLRSYRSFGFHPNWRGILYGTIVMVVMITFPRKFKRASKVVSPLFVALIITYILNFALIPPGSVPFIDMLGTAQYDTGLFSFDFSAFDSGRILPVIITGIAFAIINAIPTLTEETEAKSTGKAINLIVNSRFSFFFAAPIDEKIRLENFICAVITVLLFVLTKGFVRMPVSSCAVVLIVGAWQALDKPSLKTSGKSVFGIVMFVAVTALSAFTSLPAGIIALFAVCLIKNLVADRKSKNISTES